MNKANGNAMVSGELTVSAKMLAVERHYGVDEIASLWNFSTDKVRDIFANEPGVLVIANKAAHKRRYRTMRIPESVLIRVHRRLSN